MSEQYREGRAAILRPGPGPALARGVPALSVDGGALGAAARVPMLDVEAAGQPGRAIAAGGAAMGQAADAMTQLAQKQLQMVNERRVYEAEAARGGLLTDDLSPDARDEINSRFVRWKAQTVGQTRIESARESRRKLVSTKQAEVIRATHAGDMDLVRSLTQSMATQGLIDPDDAARMEIQAESRREQLDEEARTDSRRATSDRWSQALDADPWAAQEGLANGYFPDFDGPDILQAKAQAERAIEARQRDVLQKVRDGIVAGAPDTDDAGIDKWAESARLGAEDVAALKEFRKKYAESKSAAGPMDRQGVAKLFGEIRAYTGDEKTDPKAARWGELVQQAEVLTAAGGKEGDLTRGALMQSLYGRHPFREKRQEDPEIPEWVEDNFTTAIDAAAADGGFGVEDYRVQKKRTVDASGNMTFANEFELVKNPAAAQRRARVQTELWMALKADVKANPEKWLDPGYMDEWLFGKDGKGGRIGAIKAGGQVMKMRAQTSVAPPSTPSGDLFPKGIYSDPVSGDPTIEDINSILQ